MSISKNIKNEKIEFCEKDIKILREAGWIKSTAGTSSKREAQHNDNFFHLFIRKRRLSEVMRGKPMLEATKDKSVFENQNISDSGTGNVAAKNSEKGNKINTFHAEASKNEDGGQVEGWEGITQDDPDHDDDFSPVRRMKSSFFDEGTLLPMLSDIGEYKSLAGSIKQEDSLIIAFDSEFISATSSSPRRMLSWQFAFIDREGFLWELVFLPKTERCLTMEIALGVILSRIDYVPMSNTDRMRKYSAKVRIDGPDGTSKVETVKFEKSQDAVAAYKKYQIKFDDGKIYHTSVCWDVVEHYPITLICHAGLADLTSLCYGDSNYVDGSPKGFDFMRRCSAVQGGLITMQPFLLHPRCVNPEKVNTNYQYPVCLNIRDTMCLAPAGKKKSLENLGRVVGWNKVVLPDGAIEHMDKLLENDPKLYFEYASNDSIVALLYASAVSGYNNEVPITLTSVAASAFKNAMMAHFHVEKDSDFNRIFRGLKIVKHGLAKVHKKDSELAWLEPTSLEPINADSELVNVMAAKSYFGGYNASSVIGYYSCATFDYDLKNAYPTAMCLVPDIDWSDPVAKTIEDMDLTEEFLNEYFPNDPFPTMVASVEFEFPRSVKYPCIPIRVDGVPVYPRTSRSEEDVRVAGPDLYLAVKLGAKVHVKRGFILRHLHLENGNHIDFRDSCVSHSFQEVLKQMVSDRSAAKTEHGKGSIEEQMLKTLVNSAYGKVAQDVIRKETWSALTEEMENTGGSSITNPVAATMITSIVRSVLMAAMNQLDDMGFTSFSCTTDGFISDAPEAVLRSLDMFGIRSALSRARIYLTDGDPEIWEIKHAQDDLLNFTTRGNVSLHSADRPFRYNGKDYAGVCAHNSAVSGYASDSYEDRLWLVRMVLSRTRPVSCLVKEWITFKEVMMRNAGFQVFTRENRISMDFDLKRRPVSDSMQTVYPVIEGVSYEIANFRTEPFENTDEYRLYRRYHNKETALRTAESWKRFLSKISAKAEGVECQVRDFEFQRLCSCIRGHNKGLWKIPNLENGTVAQKIEWINRYNQSTKRFTENDWKNCKRKDRMKTILPIEYIRSLLDKMNAVIFEEAGKNG